MDNIVGSVYIMFGDVKIPITSFSLDSGISKKDVPEGVLILERNGSLTINVMDSQYDSVIKYITDSYYNGNK